MLVFDRHEDEDAEGVQRVEGGEHCVVADAPTPPDYLFPGVFRVVLAFALVDTARRLRVALSCTTPVDTPAATPAAVTVAAAAARTRRSFCRCAAAIDAAVAFGSRTWSKATN